MASTFAPGTGEVEQTNVRVMVRCRPFFGREIAALQDNANTDKNAPPVEVRSVVVMEGATVRVLDPERQYAEREAFEFDRTFWSLPPDQSQYCDAPFATQQDVFEATGKIAVENAMRGFHNTLFAYGQTGSGKTHTMLGSETDEGVAPRLVRKLFETIEEEKTAKAEDRVQFTVELSFLEIYNEKVKDLLALAEQKKIGTVGYTECRVRFHPEKGTFVEGLLRLEITTAEQCLVAMRIGMDHRAVTSTLLNDTSSRSHAIFQLCLSQKSPLKGTTKVSIINIVDLAGSERIKLSGVTGQALQEAKNINLSLSTLRRVIDILIENSHVKKGQRLAVPPYRESLLTWVLSDSLGGNSKTMMVAAVSPYVGCLEDTLGTLRYALKAKAIVCNARVNEEKTTAAVNALRAEMEELRLQLEQKANQDHAEQERLQEALKQRETEFQKMQEESKRLEDLRLQYEEELKRKAEELAKAQKQMQELENVETERVQKEGELLRAREIQTKTAELLKAQEDERKKKDAELEEVILRRDSLKRHHDAAAEEEAKARLGAEQARLRQFTSAFQNAFLLTKQKTGLQELKEECAALHQKVESLDQQINTKTEQLKGMVTDKSLLQRKVEMLEKKCQSMQSDLQDVVQSKHDRINELQIQKAAAEDELRKAQGELARRKDELERLRNLYRNEEETANRTLHDLETEREELRVDIEKKKQRLSEIKVTLGDQVGKLNGLKGTSASYADQIAALRKENAERALLLEELERKRAVLEQQKGESLSVLESRQKELQRTRETLATVTREVAALKQNHEDLRQYVAHKFFPVGSPSSQRQKSPNAASSPNGNSAARGARGPAAAKSPASPGGRVSGTPSGSAHKKSVSPAAKRP